MKTMQILTPRSQRKHEHRSKPATLVHVDRATHKIVGRGVVFEQISLRIRAGETWVIFSTNGEGGSRLLRCISGLEDIDEGSIKIKAHVSWLMGHPNGINNALSAAENSRFLAGVFGNRKTRAEELEVIQSLSGLAEQAWKEPLKNLKSLQKLSFRLAVSMAFDFDLYIIDPSVFRPLRQTTFWSKKWEKVLGSRFTNRAILTCGEDEMGIANKCQKAVVIDRGKVVAKGPTELCRAFLKKQQVR